MISVPLGTGDIADAMISASQMIYALRMGETDIISYLREQIYHTTLTYIISRKRYINESLDKL